MVRKEPNIGILERFLLGSEKTIGKIYSPLTTHYSPNKKGGTSPSPPNRNNLFILPLLTNHEALAATPHPEFLLLLPILVLLLSFDIFV